MYNRFKDKWKIRVSKLIIYSLLRVRVRERASERVNEKERKREREIKRERKKILIYI